MSGLGILFLAVFALTLFGTYIGIRRNLLDIRTAGGLCGVITVSSLFAFGIAQDLSVIHTLVIALAGGFIFTLAVVAMAAFFQANQPPNIDHYLAEEPHRQE